MSSGTAGVKKRLEESMHGHGLVSTLDARMRIAIGGPEYQVMKRWGCAEPFFAPHAR